MAQTGQSAAIGCMNSVLIIYGLSFASIPPACAAPEHDKREKAEKHELAADLDKRAKTAFKGKWLGKINADPKKIGPVVFSPDGTWAAYVEHVDERACVMFTV